VKRSDPALRLSQVLVDECAVHFRDEIPAGLSAAAAADTPDDMARVYEFLHSRNRWALCLSGGGIRSATFGLGLLQGLAQSKLLGRFGYLSTVSGGGYIGAWLSAWAHRRDRAGNCVGIEAVQEEIVCASKGTEEPPEIRHLRNYSNYLTPKLGLMSADTWAGGGIYLRNLLLHWLMLVPLFVMPMFPAYIGLQLLRTDMSLQASWLAFAIGAALLLWTVGFLSFNLPSARAWPLVAHLRDAKQIAAIQGRSQRMFLALCLIPALLSAVVLSLALAWFWQQDDPRKQADIAGSLLRWILGPLPRDDRAGITAQGAWMWQVPALAILGALARCVVWGLALWRVRQTNRRIEAFRDQHGKDNPVIAGLRPAHDLSPLTAVWELTAAAIAGAVGGLLIGIAVTQILGDPLQPGLFLGNHVGAATNVAIYLCVAPPLFLLAYLVAESLFIGLTSYVTQDEDREWWGRSGGWTLIAALGWLAFHLLVLFGPVAIEWVNENVAPAVMEKFGGLPGFLSLLSGAVTAFLGASSKTPSAGNKANTGWPARIRGLVLAAAATSFLVLMFAGLAWVLSQLLFAVSGGSDLLACSYGPRSTCTLLDENVRFRGELVWSAAAVLARQQVVYWPALGIGFAGLLVIALVAWRSINVNRFSLHATYRDRLIRCYLGAARGNGAGRHAGRSQLRYPDRFTGFDPNDNLPLHELAPIDRPAVAPLHIVNMAANLVNDKMLGWQQRKAAPFTASALHSGGDIFGYRRSKDYGGSGGISLGTAMAISGAAASPNMGYHSSPIVTLILALFNVRLGWWLGNPAKADLTGVNRVPIYGRDGPAWGAAALISECFGQTKRDSRYVYLSDGGHFENLGLYEMVRRRCRRIVVCDAGCDPQNMFADLGNAIRKIRVDLGIDIRLETMNLHPRTDSYAPGAERAGFYCGVGKILYPEGEAGTLIYLKPGLYGGEPQDVLNYACENVLFPHEPTSDQWFSESQFESYRRLGLHVGERVFGVIKPEVVDFADLVDLVKKAGLRA
jgi:hypothetical protein